LTLQCGEDKATTPDRNTAPTASFTVIPSVGATITVFEFDASGSSDAQDAVSLLQVRWDWENDGTWDTGWSTTKTASHQYGTVGTKTIKLGVRDTGGLTDYTTQAVSVSNVNIPPMVLVPAGTFEMGDGTSYCGTEEHQVMLTRSFYLGKYEVTNREYRDALQWAYDQSPRLITVSEDQVLDNVDGSTVLLLRLGPEHSGISFSNEAFSVTPDYEDHPVVYVSWYGAAAYCDWLSLQVGLERAYNHATWECGGGDPYTAQGYRLPTDGEWEYATQYGGERLYPWGDESPDCSRANYDCGTGWVGDTAPVGSYPPAPASLGLYDMAGNVWEWCNDWYECDLGIQPVTDPTGPATATYRVVRGGSWYYWYIGNLRCANRYDNAPSDAVYYNGFRCARSGHPVYNQTRFAP
jgi:formylglycine-generating enzyme required for sulfatase activity